MICYSCFPELCGLSELSCDLVRAVTRHRRMLLFWERYTKYFQHLTYRARVLVAALSKELEIFLF